ncbi:hypothetical protein SARC_17790, partial [Sphaeroforma arctica JP610]
MAVPVAAEVSATRAVLVRYSPPGIAAAILQRVSWVPWNTGKRAEKLRDIST